MIADFIDELANFETPAMAWLRNAAKVSDKQHEQWAAEDAAIAAADRKTEGKK